MDEIPVARLPIVVGELVLRRIALTDFDDLKAYWADPDGAKYQAWEPHTDGQIATAVREQSRGWAGEPGLPLVLGVETGGRVIGDCQLTVTSLESRQAEIGFQFHPGHTGRGLASRAVTAALGFAFVQLGLHRVEATTDVRHDRAWRLMERVGMRREGHFRHAAYVRGEWVDDYVYAVLDSEWTRAHPDLIPAVTGVS